MRSSARTALLLAVLATAAAVPAVADASIVEQEGSTLIYSGLGAERNNVRIRSLGTGVIDVVELGTTRIGSRTPACRGTVPGVAPDRGLRCGLSGIARIEIRLGDGDDSFSSTHPFPIDLEAGGGDDTYFATSPSGGGSQVAFSGGSGRDEASYELVPGPEGVTVGKDGFANDGGRGGRDNIDTDVEVLEGTAGRDVLSGSTRGDVFRSSAGDDLLIGGSGDDRFLMGAVRDGATRVLGGADRDTVSYAERAQRVVVSADADSSSDGEEGEGDRVEGAEVIEGGSGSDTLFVPAATEVGYRLIGGAGDDLLSSAAGRDRLIGGLGADSMSAGGDRDIIAAQDGARDTRIDCGTGPDDALIDSREVAPAGCEFVDRPGTVGELRLAASPQREAVALTLGWSHPVAWSRLRAVALRVRDGQRIIGRLTIRPGRGRVSATGAVRLAPGSRLERRGRTVRARLAVQVPAVTTGPLRVEVVATDRSGRRQTEIRPIDAGNRRRP